MTADLSLPGTSFGRTLTASPMREAVAIGLAALALFLVSSAGAPVIGRDESRFAQAAREMLARGDIVVPTFAGADRYDKPILIYWCTMAAYVLDEVDARAARLPSNLAGAAVVFLLAFVARRRHGPGSGLLAGGLLAATPVFAFESEACTADLVMLLPLTAMMLALERLWIERGGRGAAAVFWAGLGLAVLAKGPVAPAVLVGTAIAAWAMTRRWTRLEVVAAAVLAAAGWWRFGPTVLIVPLAAAVIAALRSPELRRRLAALRPAWGVPLLLAITLPWALAAYRATDGAFYRVGIGHHVVERSLSPLESHGGFPGFFLATGPVAAFPWFALALAAAFATRKVARDARTVFLLAWLLGPLLVFEMVRTKLVHYWMPSFAAGVLLVVAWLLAGAVWPRRSVSPRVVAGLLTLAIPLALLSITVAHGWIPLSVPGALLLVAWLVSGAVWPRCWVSFVTAFGGLMLAAAPLAIVLHLGLDHLVPVAIACGVPAAAAALTAALWLYRHPRRVAAATAAGSALWLLLVAALLLPALGPTFSGLRAARALVAARAPGETLAVYRARDDDLFFNLPLDTVHCHSEAELEALLARGRPVVVVSRADDLDRLRAERPELALKTVASVDGVDLGRGRWVRSVVFRPEEK